MGEDTSKSLIENVLQYSATGGSFAATIGYRMLSTLVGDIGASTVTSSSGSSENSSSPDSSSEEDESLTKIMGSPKTQILGQDWFRDRRSSSSASNKQYSSASGFDKELQLPLFTLQDVSNHDMPHDCWMVLYDRVYDVTNFLGMHPGGDEVMLEYAGLDATLAFRSVGHSREAEQSLKPYLIGILVENERIWTRFFNMKSDVPEH